VREISALIAVIIQVGGAAWYCYVIVKRRVQPPLASWILFATAITISFAAYWDTPRHTLIGNIGNFIAMVNIWGPSSYFILRWHGIKNSTSSLTTSRQDVSRRQELFCSSGNFPIKRPLHSI
jgi:hypothetical protein